MLPRTTQRGQKLCEDRGGRMPARGPHGPDSRQHHPGEDEKEDGEHKDGQSAWDPGHGCSSPAGRSRGAGFARAPDGGGGGPVPQRPDRAVGLGESDAGLFANQTVPAVGSGQVAGEHPVGALGAMDIEGRGIVVLVQRGQLMAAADLDTERSGALFAYLLDARLRYLQSVRRVAVQSGMPLNW